MAFTFRRTKNLTSPFSSPITGTIDRKVSVSSNSSLGLIGQRPSAEVQKKISAIKAFITYGSSNKKLEDDVKFQTNHAV